MRAQSIRPPRQPIHPLKTAKIVINATRLGYTGNEQLKDFSTVSNFWPYENEEQAIAVNKLDPATQLSLQHNQLVPKRSVLGLKPAYWLERREQQAKKKA